MKVRREGPLGNLTNALAGHAIWSETTSMRRTNMASATLGNKPALTSRCCAAAALSR